MEVVRYRLENHFLYKVTPRLPLDFDALNRRVEFSNALLQLQSLDILGREELMPRRDYIRASSDTSDGTLLHLLWWYSIRWTQKDTKRLNSMK